MIAFQDTSKLDQKNAQSNYYCEPGLYSAFIFSTIVISFFNNLFLVIGLITTIYLLATKEEKEEEEEEQI